MVKSYCLSCCSVCQWFIHNQLFYFPRSLAQPHHVTSERSSVPTSTTCLSVGSTTTGNHTLEVCSQPRNTQTCGLQREPQSPKALLESALCTLLTPTLRKSLWWSENSSDAERLGLSERSGLQIYKVWTPRVKIVTRTNTTSIFDFSPTRFSIACESCGQKPQSEAVFLVYKKMDWTQ